MQKHLLTHIIGGFFLWLCLISTVLGQAPSIQQVRLDTAQVGLFEKFEAFLDLSATYSNPYDYDQVRVGARFLGPGNRTVEVDGFFAEDYELTNLSNGSINKLNSAGFRVRFAPDTVGQWTVQIWVEDANGVDTASSLSFDCVYSQQPQNQGYIRSNSSNYLSFDSGNPYIAIGHNIAWPNGNRITNYTTWLDKLSDNGGNFFRLWHCHWGISLEWLGSGYGGLRDYRQDNAFYLDWLHEYCHDQGIYMMVCLQHHGQVSSQINPNWSESPYNTANGGMCANTWDFFTHSAAKAATQNRFRYIVARYGYARSVMAWELFNEVNWTDNYAQHEMDIADWHQEMAAYLKSIDPYGHLVTTSFAEESQGGLVWTLPEIDLTQTHFYLPTANLERVVAQGASHYLDLYDKPTLVGEFGINAQSVNLSSLDPDGIYVHNSLFGGFFGGGFGTGGTWWWDSYIQPQDLYYHYKGLAELVQLSAFQTDAFGPADSYVTGVSGDLSLTPTLGWGVVADPVFTIDPQGNIQPSGAALANYLYGATWNTQFRSPPTFQVTLPAPGRFEVKTGSATGQDPRIIIEVDGIRVLDENAITNQTYSVNVAAGQHQIKVENIGTDWITISGYEITGLGAGLDTYTLKSQSKDRISAWILNPSYNHEEVNANGIPNPIKGATMVIPDVASGTFYAKWYNALTNAWVATETVTTKDDTLFISVPDVSWDLNLVIDDQFVTGQVKLPQQQPIAVYPNPIGYDPFVIRLPDLQGSDQVFTISLLAVDGKEIYQWQMGMEAGTQEIQLSLPSSIPNGTYWLRIRDDQVAGAVPVLVGR